MQLSDMSSGSQLAAITSSGCLGFFGFGSFCCGFCFVPPPPPFLFHANTVLIEEFGLVNSCYSRALTLSQSGLSVLSVITYLLKPVEANRPTFFFPGGESM